MDVNPRREPRQARAKATVEAIVEAATQLLSEEGYERFTTARAAERAGVSVGSLYQYFPNKAALASAVIERAGERFLAAFSATLERHDHDSLAQCIDAIIDESLVSHRLTPELHRVVHNLASRLGVAEKSEQVSRATTTLIEGLLRKHADEIAAEIDIAAAATIIEVVLEALAHRLKLSDTLQMQDDMLARETKRLIIRYLSGSAPSARGDLHHNAAVA